MIWGLFLRIMGWTVKGDFPIHLKKCVVLVAPHTSSWDFVIGIAIRSQIRITHAKFLGKDSLFKGPFGFIFRRLGGYPVDRSSNHNIVEQAVALFHSHESFVLVLSPEGTRQKVDRLKTGFYHIAKNAGVPIVMAALDFEKKQCYYAEPFYPSGDEAADFQHIYQFYAPIKGKNPDQGMAHLLNTPT